MIIHLLAFTLEFLPFLMFCQGYMLYEFLLFWRALSCFWHVASCAVVKSALTRSSYLLVVSVLQRVCARYILRFSAVFAYMSMIYRLIQRIRGVEGIGKRIRGVEGIGKSIRIKLV